MNNLKFNIKKYYPGGSLNPMNWFLPTYDTEKFTEAFAFARKNGDKQFKWKGKIYNTNLISEEAQKEYDNSVNFIENIVSQLKPEHVNINKLDSLTAEVNHNNKVQKHNEPINKEREDKEELLKYYEKRLPEDDTKWTDADWEYYFSLDELRDDIDSLWQQVYYPTDSNLMYSYRLPEGHPIIYQPYKDSIYNNILNKIKNLSQLKPIVTTQADPKNPSQGYVDRRTGEVYINLNSPGTAVHELSHYVGLDVIQGKGEIPFNDTEYYIRIPEIGAREWARKYLNHVKGIDGPENIDRLTDKQLAEYLDIPERILKVYKDYYKGDIRKNYFQSTTPIYYKKNGGTINYLNPFNPFNKYK